MGTYKTIILAGQLYPRMNLLYVTSTTGGTHAPGSWHYRGCAVDFGSGVENAAELKAAGTTRWKEMDSMARWWYSRSGLLVELIHTAQDGSGWYVKNGVRRGPYDAEAHKDHIHVAVATDANVIKMFTHIYQWTLDDLGYTLAVDGDPGPATVAAVKRFQKDHGLTVDGKVGSLTVKALRKAEGWGAL